MTGTMRAIFFLSFTIGMFMLFIGFARLVINNCAALMKQDGKTEYRKRKDKNIHTHFIITAVLFIIAAMTQFG